MDNFFNKLVKILVVLSMLTLASSFLIHKINLPASDLGRHIKNGQIVFSEPQVLWQNLYSYTEPEFPFVNHHWASGVVFAGLLAVAGWNSLIVLKLLLMLTAFLLSFYLAKKRSNFYLAALLALPTIILLSERTEIRPELFSYLLFMIYWLGLDSYKVKGWQKRFYAWPFLQIIWTNLHIYSFLGLFLLVWQNALDLIKLRFKFFKSRAKRKFLIVSVITVLAALVNPNFFKGWLYPLKIFNNYGYEIVENKSPWFLESLILNNNIFVFKWVIVLLVLSFVISIATRKKVRWFELGLSLFVISAGWFAVRNLTLVGLISLPVMAQNFYDFTRQDKRQDKESKWQLFLLIALIILYSVLSWQVVSGHYYDKKTNRKNLGWGLVENVEQSVNFFKDNNLKGPIFNNYDNGSFLTYYFYPQEKVFVDNRPEAFSVEFFTELYKPMQLEEEVWQKAEEKYNFQVIYFAHTDGTFWAQKFFSKKLKDDVWPLIYIDPYVAIFARRNGINQRVVEEYEIKPESVKEYLDNLKNQYQDAKSLLSIASLYQEFNLKAEAREIYRDFLDKNPNNLSVKASLGYSYMVDDPGQAIRLLEEVAESGWRLPSIYNNLGLLYFYSGDFNKARQAWKETLWLDKDNATANNYLEQLDSLVR